MPLPPTLFARATEILPPGFRPLPVGVHALVGGKVVVKPGEVIEGGTIVLRDGLIQAVGKDIAVPADARVWDMKGMVIYAGFIDSCLTLSSTNSPLEASENEPVTSATLASGGITFYGAPPQKPEAGNAGPGYQVVKITPQYRAVREYGPKEKALAPFRELGFTAGLVVPSKGIIRGTSALVALSDENPNDAIIQADVFQHIAFETHRSDDRAYPGALMGVVASVRQAFFDAQHYALDHADFEKNPRGRKRPGFDPALEALQPAATKKMRVVFEPGSALMVDRAAQISKELGLDFCIFSCGQEWRRPDLIKATAAPFIVPLNFPALPKLPDESDWEQVELDPLRAWDWAPENPALLRRQGLEIALTTAGLSEKKKFRANLRLALDRGLSEDDALAALTTAPAKLCGAENRLGTIEAGKLANLTVVDGKGYFDPEAKVRAVWVDGRIYPVPLDEAKSAKKEEKKSDTDATDKKEGSKKEQLRQLQGSRIARSPQEGRGPLAEPKSVLINHATIWTCGPKGVLTNAELLISGGKIEAIGADGELKGGSDVIMIDGRNLHVTPGIIDCHSHTAILGLVNESTLPSTAMVRIQDVVNSETGNLYQQLAGGVTMRQSVTRFRKSHRRAELRHQAARRRKPGRPGVQGCAAGNQVRARRKREGIQLGRKIRDALPADAHGRAHIRREPIHGSEGISRGNREGKNFRRPCAAPGPGVGGLG